MQDFSKQSQGCVRRGLRGVSLPAPSPLVSQRWPVENIASRGPRGVKAGLTLTIHKPGESELKEGQLNAMSGQQEMPLEQNQS